MLTISGRQPSDTAVVVANKYIATWSRAVGGSSHKTCVSIVTMNGQRVASLHLVDALEVIVDVGISPDGTLAAVIGTNNKGQPVVAIGDGVFCAVKTNHSLAKVIVLSGTHIAVADSNGTVFLFVVSRGTAINESSSPDEASAFSPLSVTSHLNIETVIDWIAIPMSSGEIALAAIVRNSHVIVLRLDNKGTQSVLRRCASSTFIPAAQRLSFAAIEKTNNSVVLWVASGKECCAALLSAEGSGLKMTMMEREGQPYRALLPGGSVSRRVTSLSAISPHLAFVTLQPDEEHTAAGDNVPFAAATSSTCGGGISDICAVDAFTVSYSRLSSLVMARHTPLACPGGHALINVTYHREGFVGFVTNSRQRTVSMLRLVPIAASEASDPITLDFQHRMDRAKVSLSSLINTVPASLESSQELINSLLKVQDELQLLQRSVEGSVRSSAPNALLQQLNVALTRAAVRHLYYATNTPLDTCVDTAFAQAAFKEGLSALRSVTMETLFGLPGSDNPQLDLQRWGATQSIFSLLFSCVGVVPSKTAIETDVNDDACGVDGANSEGTPGSVTDSSAAKGTGAAILECCSEHLSSEVIVATLYTIIALKATTMETLEPLATALLQSRGLSHSLLHWALLFYIADFEPATDISGSYPHLLSLDHSYSFGASVLPRVVDSFACAGNIEAVYLLAPSLLRSASFAISDRLATRFFLAAIIKGNASLIGAMLSASGGRGSSPLCVWRSVAVHVAAVACASMGDVGLLEGAVGGKEEEAIVEGALRAVGTRVAHRVFIEFLVMQRHFTKALSMCEEFPIGTDAEHQAVTALAATLRCLVPSSKIDRNKTTPAFDGFSKFPDTDEVLLNAHITASVDSLKVPSTYVDTVAALSAASSNAGGGLRK